MAIGADYEAVLWKLDKLKKKLINWLNKLQIPIPHLKIDPSVWLKLIEASDDPCVGVEQVYCYCLPRPNHHWFRCKEEGTCPLYPFTIFNDSIHSQTCTSCCLLHVTIYVHNCQPTPNQRKEKLRTIEQINLRLDRIATPMTIQSGTNQPGNQISKSFLILSPTQIN